MPALPFPDPPLRTDSIVLRPWSRDDIPAIVIACQDPDMPRYIPTIPVPYTEADAHRWLAYQEPKRVAGELLELAIAEARSGQVLGAIAAGGVDLSQLSATIGYWLAPQARGRGHMTAAVRLLCRWLFDELGLRRLQLMTDPENLASQRVAERCGFQKEGRLCSHLLYPHSGRRRDSLIWGLLPGELT